MEPLTDSTSSTYHIGHCSLPAGAGRSKWPAWHCFPTPSHSTSPTHGTTCIQWWPLFPLLSLLFIFFPLSPSFPSSLSSFPFLPLHLFLLSFLYLYQKTTGILHQSRIFVWASPWTFMFVVNQYIYNTGIGKTIVNMSCSSNTL